MPARYDAIGRTYAATRSPDPRIARAIVEALGDVATVVNVGAGAGAYEPRDRAVTAVEPSRTMLEQRPATGRVVQAVAEALPFADRTFDAAMGVLTIHHWSDPDRGLEEMKRVARGRVVLLTFDTEVGGFWLTDEYFPAIAQLDHGQMPSIERVARVLETDDVRVVNIPADCVDGFLGAFWARPEAYVDPAVVANMSAFALIDPADRDAGMQRLSEDLASGRWEERHGRLRSLPAGDLGYRLVVAGG